MTIAIPSLRAITCTPQWVRNDLWRRARAVPSLDLQFADRKSLVDAISGQNLITFTRASSGTYVDSAGVLQTAGANEPRFDHNPTTGASLGLLVEEQRTNLLTFSEDFNNWGLASATRTTDQNIAPNGTLTADRVESTGGGVYQVGQAVANATVYTYSVFLKHVSGTGVIASVGFERFGPTPLPAQSAFNLLTGAVVNNGSSVTTSTITSFGNGWYRVSVTATSTDVTATITNYASASGDQFLIWGAQLEAGAFPTSYIPTTSSAVTRNADVASISGSNFSSWYRQDEGTVSLQGITSADNGGFLTFGDGSAADYTRLGRGFGLLNLVVSTAGETQADIYTNGSSLALGQPFRLASSYRVNDFATCLNGLGLATDTAGSPPSASNSLNIGLGLYTGFINGHIRRLVYWRERLANNVLQSITQ